MDGKERRLRKILNKKTGRSLVLAVDHGMALGAMTGIVDIAGTIRALDATDKVDCWLMTKGIYSHAFDPAGDPGVILRASGGATRSDVWMQIVADVFQVPVEIRPSPTPFQ